MSYLVLIPALLFGWLILVIDRNTIKRWRARRARRRALLNTLNDALASDENWGTGQQTDALIQALKADREHPPRHGLDQNLSLNFLVEFATYSIIILIGFAGLFVESYDTYRLISDHILNGGGKVSYFEDNFDKRIIDNIFYMFIFAEVIGVAVMYIKDTKATEPRKIVKTAGYIGEERRSINTRLKNLALGALTILLTVIVRQIILLEPEEINSGIVVIFHVLLLMVTVASWIAINIFERKGKSKIRVSASK